MSEANLKEFAMRRKTVFLLVLFFMFHVLLYGCKNADKTVNSDVPVDINTGVITETVADVFNEPDITSERITQAIFNQPVAVVEEQEDWTKVKVVDGYTGWVRSKYIDRDCSSIDENFFEYRIVITSKQQGVYSQARGGITIKNVVMGTELYSRNKVDGAYEVALPGKLTGWVKESGTILIPSGKRIPKTTAEDFVTTAVKFKGTRYLWGGVSGQGIDCSGFTYICGRINGVDMPRDVKGQSDIGLDVSADSLKPGDILFFSDKEDSNDIAHEGIYTGDKEFIHVDSVKGYVLIASLDSEYYQKRLVEIKRVF